VLANDARPPGPSYAMAFTVTMQEWIGHVRFLAFRLGFGTTGSRFKLAHCVTVPYVSFQIKAALHRSHGIGYLHFRGAQGYVSQLPPNRSRPRTMRPWITGRTCLVALAALVDPPQS